MNGEVFDRVVFAIQVAQNDGDHLWSIPLPRFHLELFLALVADAVKSKRAVPHIARRVVIHEQVQELEILHPDIFIRKHVEMELGSDNVSLQSVKENHLTGPHHASPALVRSEARVDEWLLQAVSVSEPGDGLELLLEPVIQRA